MRYALFLIAVLAALVSPPALAQPESEELFNCGYLCTDDGPLMTSGTTEPPDTELVRKIFLGIFSEACGWAIGGGRDMWEPEIHDLTYRPIYLGDDDPDLQLRLYRFFCGAGAYNVQHVYMTWTSDNGVVPVSFARPTYRVEEISGDIDGGFTGIALTGMDAGMMLVNSRFDPATRTISEWSCWRGLCDASSRGEWVVDGERGAFRLVSYDIDPSYDGETNLYRVADFTTPVPVDITTPQPHDFSYFDEAGGDAESGEE